MTVPSSGDRIRRGGRRPGWALLTILLVLAIAASTALVFTNRVELLKLAVILALWAAVVGAFVSVIYRRQSDADAAKARDLKLVYDLQLDREISARREYELGVETHLRRELAGELRAQSSDEVAALRAELTALRTSLEILFDTDLAQRPALETDRSYSEWTGPPAPPRPDRVASSRITEVVEDDDVHTAESPIIDVPEEPLFPPRHHVPTDQDMYRGSHRRPSEDTGWNTPVQPDAVVPQPTPDLWTPQSAPPPAADLWTPPPAPAAPRPRVSQPQSAPPPPTPLRPPVPQPQQAPEAPQPQATPQMAPPVPPVQPRSQPQQPPSASGPQPPATPQMAPPAPPPAAAVPNPPANPPAAPPPANQQPVNPPADLPRRGRHSSTPPEPAPPPARHGAPATPEPEPALSARHRGESGEEVADGQSVADLLARLQQSGSAGGGRRRRSED